MSSNKTVGKKKTSVAKKPVEKTTEVKPLLLLLPALLIGFVISFVIVSRLNDSPVTTSAGAVTIDGITIHNVDVHRDNDQPIDLLVNKGEYVQFNSKDGGNHQIVLGGHGSDHHGGEGQIDSGVFKAEEGYRVQFKESGKFNFHDNLDRDYTITIIVYDPSKSAEDNKIKN